jgi:hypothetical protein
MRGTAVFRGLICLCCAALTGCLLNTSQTRVTADHTATITKVGVLSLVNAQPNISYLSTSAMESNFSNGVLKGWDADALVYEKVVQRLQRKGFDVSVIHRDDNALGIAESTWGYRDTSEIHERLFQAGAAKGIDMLVVVYPNVAEDFVTKTNQNVRGYGLQKAFDTGLFAYATIGIEAMDIKKRFIAGKAEGRQIAPLSESVWRPRYETHTGLQSIEEPHRTTIFESLSTLLTNAIGIAASESGI